jgi:hypothetical protein
MGEREPARGVSLIPQDWNPGKWQGALRPYFGWHRRRFEAIIRDETVTIPLPDDLIVALTQMQKSSGGTSFAVHVL